MSSPRSLGDVGEQLAARWYEQNGYRILDRNWRAGRAEIDIVAGRDDLVVFCEVKTRRSDRFGAPIEAVDEAKVRRIRVVASEWLRAHDAAVAVRFDVASVRPDRTGALAVEVVERAF